MNQSELASRSGVSMSFVSDLANGKANPSIKTMESIANALGISLPVLLEPVTCSAQKLHNGLVKLSSVILPEQKAFIVLKWDDHARKQHLSE